MAFSRSPKPPSGIGNSTKCGKSFSIVLALARPLLRVIYLPVPVGSTEPRAQSVPRYF